MIASTCLVGAVSINGRQGKSDDMCISSGSENDEIAADRHFHHVKGLITVQKHLNTFIDHRSGQVVLVAIGANFL